MAQPPKTLRVVLVANEQAVTLGKLRWQPTGPTSDRGGDELPVAKLPIDVMGPERMASTDPKKLIYPIVGLQGPIDVEPAFFLKPPSEDSSTGMIWELVSTHVHVLAESLCLYLLVISGSVVLNLYVK